MLRMRATESQEPQLNETAGPRDYVQRNRLAWDALAPQGIVNARKAWAADELRWGLWNLPESELNLLEGIEPGSDVIELGCGSAAISAWLKRRGMYPVAVDISPAQLRVAETLQRELGPQFPLVLANAEDVPYDHGSFDLAISEYGASTWCEPRRWLQEARRLLKPGGKLVFFTPSAFLTACTPDDGSQPGTQLERSYFASGGVEYGDAGVEFHATHGEWLTMLRTRGFVVEALIETLPAGASEPRYQLASRTWASRWPSEEIWVARVVDTRETVIR